MVSGWTLTSHNTGIVLHETLFSSLFTRDAMTGLELFAWNFSPFGSGHYVGRRACYFSYVSISFFKINGQINIFFSRKIPFILRARPVTVRENPAFRLTVTDTMVVTVIKHVVLIIGFITVINIRRVQSRCL